MKLGLSPTESTQLQVACIRTAVQKLENSLLQGRSGMISKNQQLSLESDGEEIGSQQQQRCSHRINSYSQKDEHQPQGWGRRPQAVPCGEQWRPELGKVGLVKVWDWGIQTRLTRGQCLRHSLTAPRRGEGTGALVHYLLFLATTRSCREQGARSKPRPHLSRILHLSAPGAPELECSSHPSCPPATRPDSRAGTELGISVYFLGLPNK